MERPVASVKMKMKEDKNEKKCIKKVKNPESVKDCLPKNCTGDDGRLVVGKKAKKSKKVDLVVINTEKESWVVGDEKEEKMKRFVPESLSDADGADVENENDKKVIKKKKKKKELAYGGNQVEIAQDSVKEVEGKKHRKEKKVKNKSAQLQSENVQIDEEEEQLVEKDKLSKKATMEEKKTLVDNMEMTEGQLEKKKRKKKKTIERETTETTNGISVKKKNSKARVNVAETEAKSEIPEGEPREVKKDKRKRGRKKEGGNEVDTPQVKDSRLSGKKGDSTENVTAIAEEEMVPKKKKRKGKKLKGEEEQPSSLKSEEVEEQNRETLVKVALDTKRRKRKEMSTKEETHEVDNVSFEHGARKKMRGQMEGQNESAQLDVDLLSEKSANTDEIAINQERRQSDQTTQPQKTATPTGLGQWSTAQFKSSDEQQKFLRLMGGFKKGSQLAAGNTGRANMALGKDAQQQLQRGLQGEFERAHSRRLDLSNRGAGLGFAAPSNKKFSIDINECRSVRFDD